MLAVPVCSTQIIRICGLKILHPSIGLSIYCRCIVFLALHEKQIGVNEPEGNAVVRQFSVALLTLQYVILLISIPFYFFGSADGLVFGY
jgi:hypothetical protein